MQRWMQDPPWDGIGAIRFLIQQPLSMMPHPANSTPISNSSISYLDLYDWDRVSRSSNSEAAELLNTINHGAKRRNGN
jgi:hypothetical protein